MDGSGISEQNGYTEETSVDVCMQLDTADCTKYQDRNPFTINTTRIADFKEDVKNRQDFS